jgi:hypothetical protein
LSSCGTIFKTTQRQGRRIEGDNIMINCTPHAIVPPHPAGRHHLPPERHCRSGHHDRDFHRHLRRNWSAGHSPGRQLEPRLFCRVPGEVTGLPEDGTPCIVSAMVLAALPPGTPGVYAPDTGATAVRNDRGHIMAVTRLVAA